MKIGAKKVIALFAVVTFVMTGCSANNGNNKEVYSAEKNLAKGVACSTCPIVVKDREVWKDFISDEKDINLAMNSLYGIHFPEILLTSKDAKEANAEIEKLVRKAENEYKEIKKNRAEIGMDEEDLGVSAEFSVYQDDGVVSVLLTTYDGYMTYRPIYNTYNFSLPNGKRLSDKDLMKKFGSDIDYLALMENSIHRDSEESNAVFMGNAVNHNFFNAPYRFEGETYLKLWDDVKKGDSKIFLDEWGDPHFHYINFIPAGPGFYESILSLQVSAENQNLYSDVYLKMAKKLGVDPEANDAFMIFLGYAHDDVSVRQILSKLHVWERTFMKEGEAPKLSLCVKYNEETLCDELIGEEYYLLVPKWKHAVVKLTQLDPDANGGLKPVENYYLDDFSVVGPTLICQNRGEGIPNAKITLRYRDKKREFSPLVSLRDGTPVFPPKIYDAGDILDWDSLAREGFYNESLYEAILSLIGYG